MHQSNPEAPTVEEFTAEVTDFLEANSSPRPTATEFVWGDGDDDVALFEALDPETAARPRAGGRGRAGGCPRRSPRGH